MGPLASIAITIGAPILGSILRNVGGPAGGIAADVAETALKKIGERLGVEPTEGAIVAEYGKNPDATAEALREVSDEMAKVWEAGVHGQFALLQSESQEGFWQSAWRWGWMYLLAFFWIWRVIFLPVFNASSGVKIEAIDLAVLLTLTSWFIGLYMGGHTIKELGKSIAGAMTKRKA